MPEYEVRAGNLPEGADPGTVFLRAYLECAEWCGVDEEQRARFERAGNPRWTKRAMEQARQDCEAFREENAADLEGMDPSQAGHDFWLTRNRHGAGFWDRGLGELGERLSKSARVWGSVGVDYWRGFLHLV